MSKRINSDKPHLWKKDIAASVDQFNQWFIGFAPDTFRATRRTATEKVKLATNLCLMLTPTGDLAAMLTY